jgi:hypothetical protein
MVNWISFADDTWNQFVRFIPRLKGKSWAFTAGNKKTRMPKQISIATLIFFII